MASPCSSSRKKISSATSTNACLKPLSKMKEHKSWAGERFPAIQKSLANLPVNACHISNRPSSKDHPAQKRDYPLTDCSTSSAGNLKKAVRKHMLPPVQAAQLCTKVCFLSISYGNSTQTCSTRTTKALLPSYIPVFQPIPHHHGNALIQTA